MSDNGCTNSDKRHYPLRIERMPDGGFVVSDTPSFGDNTRYCPALFASTSIGEALVFIAGRLDPEAKPAAELRCVGCVDPRCLFPHCKIKAAAELEASRNVATPREPSLIVRHCARCGSSGMDRYCSRCNRPAREQSPAHEPMDFKGA